MQYNHRWITRLENFHVESRLYSIVYRRGGQTRKCSLLYLVRRDWFWERRVILGLFVCAISGTCRHDILITCLYCPWVIQLRNMVHFPCKVVWVLYYVKNLIRHLQSFGDTRLSFFLYFEGVIYKKRMGYTFCKDDLIAYALCILIFFRSYHVS